jgi:hypothetical protein
MANPTIKVEMMIDGRTAVGEVEIDRDLLNIWPQVMADEMARAGKMLCDQLAELHKAGKA